MPNLRPPSGDTHILEITLISAQALKKCNTYAVLWVHPSAKLRTHVDRAGGESPTWNDKFLFQVPSSFLAQDSSAAVNIEIYASGYLVDSLVGSVRFIVGNQSLLNSGESSPSFAAVGVRRPSGRFEGILNVGSILLSNRQVSAAARGRLEKTGAAAVGVRRLRIPPPPPPTAAAAAAAEEEKENGSCSGKEYGNGVKGWFGYQRKMIHHSASEQNLPQMAQERIHLSPSDPNLRQVGRRGSLRTVMDGGD